MSEDAFPVRLYRPRPGRLGVLTGPRVLDRAALGPAGVLLDPARVAVNGGTAYAWTWPEARSPFAAAALAHAGLGRTAAALTAAVRGNRRDVEPFDLGAFSGVADGRDLTDAVLSAAFDDARATLARALPAGRRLRPFQAAGVTFARASGYRVLIGDAPGLGKTAQALACIALEGDALLPALAVAPSSAFGNWRKEASMWIPGVKVRGLGSRSDTIPPGFRGLVITTWALLADHADAIAAWGPVYVIADEAHYAKNPDAQRHQALVSLTRRAPYCALLTGTPLKNQRADLATLIDILDDAPDRPSDPRAALRAWRLPPDPPPDPEEAEEEDKAAAERRAESDLMRRVRGRMVRRLKVQVLDELPPKVRVDRDVVLPEDIRAEYDLANKEFEEWLGAEYERRLKEEGATTAEARAEAEERVARAMKSAAMVKIGYLRAIAARGKIDAALSVVTDLLRRREPVVVFADHLEVIEALSKRLTLARVKHAKIIGATSKDARDAAIEGFQKPTRTRKEAEEIGAEESQRFQDGTLDVLLCSQAAKEAITLHRSCNVVFVERFWTPADEEQAEDRVHRIGQHRPVTITRLRALDTVDVRIGEILDAKADLVARTIGAANVDQKEGELLADISASFVLDRLRERRGVARQNIAPRRSGPAKQARGFRLARGDVQAFIFPAADWTPEDAMRWLQRSRFPTADATATPGGLRVEIRPALHFARASFRALRLDGGVIAVVGRRLRQ